VRPYLFTFFFFTCACILSFMNFLAAFRAVSSSGDLEAPAPCCDWQPPNMSGQKAEPTRNIPHTVRRTSRSISRISEERWVTGTGVNRRSLQ
jgi:hypothetical protein